MTAHQTAQSAVSRFTAHSSTDHGGHSAMKSNENDQRAHRGLVHRAKSCGEGRFTSLSMQKSFPPTTMIIYAPKVDGTVRCNNRRTVYLISTCRYVGSQAKARPPIGTRADSRCVRSTYEANVTSRLLSTLDPLLPHLPLCNPHFLLRLQTLSHIGSLHKPSPRSSAFSSGRCPSLHYFAK